ncbi:RING finger protein ETP1 [Rhodotorula toruloides]|nr:RING finger protein ETP1 [Rhodotorula toruloides]
MDSAPNAQQDSSQASAQPQQHPSPVSPAFPPSASQQPTPGQAADNGSLLPPHPVASSAGPSTSAPSPAPPTTRSTRKTAPPIIAFDPSADGSDDDDDDEEGGPKKKRRATAGARASSAKGSGNEAGGSAGPADPDDKGRRKIEIEYIQKKEKRHITFSKRKAGIMKKAYELATLTGTEVLLLVVSETGIVYTFTTTKFQTLVSANPDGTPSEGQKLIQKCLAVSPDDENSDYISPPPDGPLLPLPPSAQKRPFEANSPIHGGQIALRTRQHRPRAKARPPPIATQAANQTLQPPPSIHGQMEQMNQLPPSPHHVHPLNPPPPPGSMAEYPPSPGYPPPGHPRSGLPSPAHPPQEYGEMMNGQYGPPANYPPPPALGYTHQLPNPNRPPHPLDPYPHPQHQGSPSSSPRQPRQLPPPLSPMHATYHPAPPRSMQDPYGDPRYPPPPPAGEDMHMMSPLPHPPPMHHSQPAPGLPQPPPEMYMHHGPPHSQGPPMQPSPRQVPMQYEGPGGDAYARRVVIECYDHTSPRSINPLIPNTATRLPHSVNQELCAVQHRLVLPSQGDLWRTRLPRTRALDTRNPSTVSAGLSPSALPSPPLEPRTPPGPRIWSESFGLPSPPPIATAELWTPSRGDLPKTTHKPILDFRFGPLFCDSIDYPEPRGMTRHPGGKTSPSLGQTQPQPPRPAETSGTTELNWGIVHLYREAGAEESTQDEKHRAKEEDDGRAVGLVSVPGVLNAAALLSFIAPALDDIEQVRMLRDSTPNRSLVLIRFRDAAKASEFKRVYNSKPYWDTKDSEICHVVSISAAKLKSTSTPPFTFPTSSASSDGAPSDAVELPTCPVCLEILDSRVTGLVQTFCGHTHHCNCLLKWGDSRCPVCRSTNARQRRNTVTATEAADSKCAVCQSPSNLWICVICGNVGCGRYQGGHAHSHFTDTGHSFSLEVETGRIWSYLDDEYVHRLIRLRPSAASPGDRIIELPSISSSSAARSAPPPSEGDTEDLSAKIGSSYASQAGGPDRDAEDAQDKLEALALEYGNLMSSQLASQREWFEEEVAREKERVRVGERVRKELEGDCDGLRRAVREREKEVKGLREAWEKEKRALEGRIEVLEREVRHEQDERKKERADLVKGKKQLERDLESERAVSASLTQNLAALRADFLEEQKTTASVRGEVDDLKDQLNDLMAALSMRDRIEQEGPSSEWAGASIGVAPAPGTQQQQAPKNPSAAKAAQRKKKKK